MKNIQIGMKIMNKFSGLVNIFFGSDEKAWFTLTLVTVFLYFNGLPNAAIITAVYSSIFAYGGMQKYNDTQSSSSSNSTNQDLEEMQGMMEDALGMAEEFKEDTEGEQK
jgi:hypothetical protein